MIEVEIPDGTIVEFPDEMSQDDIKSVLQKKFPVTQSFAPSLPQEEIVQKYFGAAPAAPVQAPPPLFDESMRQVPMRTTTGTTPTPMMAYDLPPEERRAQFKEDILTPAVPLPRLTIDPKESPVTAAGKEAVNVLIGVPEFVETPAGILSFGAAAIAPILTAGGFTADMLYNLGKQIKTAYGNWDKMTPAEKTVAVVDMAGTGAFAALTGTAAGRGIQRRLEPPQMKATRELARVLETTEPMGTVQPRQPIRQLGIPQAALTAEPFLQPGIPELAGQALREAQSPLTIPGRTPAIEMLRRELAPPEVVPVESRLAGRIPERGGTMVTPTLEGVQVQPRVLRSASDILLERFVGREPMAPEALPIPPEVQAAVKPPVAPAATRATSDVSIQKQRAANPPAAAPKPITPQAPEVKPKRVGLRARKVFDRETELNGPDILSWIAENMKMESKSQAQRNRPKEWWQMNKSDWDDAPSMARPHHNVIYGGTSTPNRVAQAAFDAGVLDAPTAPALWRAIEVASQKRSHAFERMRREESQLEADAEFTRATTSGDLNVVTEELRVGDTFEVEGETFKVKSVDAQTGEVTLDDGKKFGRQYMQPGKSIWVENPSDAVVERVAESGEQFGVGEPLKLEAPETVAEQKTRLAEEKKRKAAKAALEEGAQRKLTGKDLDTTKEMFTGKEATEINRDKTGQGYLSPQPPSDIISKLESLKLPETGEGNLYAFPHPDAIKAIGRSTWNTAIDVAIASVKAGKAIAQAVDDAIAYLRKNVRGLDEAQARANLEYVAREETQPTVQIPSTEGETIKMRKSAEHATTSPMVPEPVQERITKAPESFYPQQSVPRVKDVVEDMSDANLAAMPKDSNLYVAARLKLIDRLFQRGDLNAGYNVFVELEKGGTTMGQLINQFKLLKGSRPENVVRLLNEKLKREGKDVLNPEQQQRALEKVVTSKQKDAALDKATNDWRKEPSLENAEAAEKALLDANAAAVDLQRFVSRFSPRSTASILKSILQGGLLTPISEVANIVGNMSFLPFRAGDRTIASFLDVLDNHLLGTKRQITVQPVRGTAEAVKGFGRGASQIPEIFRRGTGDVIKGETRAGLHPIQAWINQFVSNPEMPTTGGKLTLNDRLNLFLEGTLGVPTEAMLRGLGAGDIAFREAAKGRATATELALSKVPKDQWSFAQKFPELFLDEAALDRINTQTTQAVFQRPSKTLNVIVNRIRGIGEWFDLLTATIAPYKLTPWNIVGEILSYNPLVAFTRSLNDIRTGNRLAAKLNTGKYIVGSALATAGWWLYSKGLMSPSLDQRDEQTKARVLAGEIMPPNHINISGLNRSMDKFAKLQKPTLEDTAFRSGDETVDVFRAGGLAGSMFYMMANIGRDFERKPEVANSEIWQSILTQSTLEQARFGMNQSFLSGVEGLLSAVREGNTDNFVRQWGNTVASIPFPNTLTVLSRATREFKPDFREDTFRKQMENVIRNKLGFAGLDDYLPLQRGLWGEPIRETPEGRNSILYHFFDVTKNRQVTSDPGKIELFRLWRKTADSRIIPSIPERQITVQSKNYPLNGEQYSRYAELVGKERKRIFDAIVVNPQFHKLSDEAKVAGLDRIYRAGLDAGKAKFWKERGATLIPKPPRAGFAPAP